MDRQAGILLHISSLPNKYGIGTLGASAYKFIDFLADAKQSVWQVLPLNPTSYGDSPYQSVSVFAYNPYFIDFDLLAEDKLLLKSDYEKIDFGNNRLDIDYAKLFNSKINVLKKAYENKDLVLEEYTKFLTKNSFWLDDYALFLAIKEYFSYMAWNYWPPLYRIGDNDVLEVFKKNYAKEIDTIRFIQYLFYRQWTNLKNYANSKNIEIIGDMPIYVAYDSVEVWRHPEMFMLDQDLKPTAVAGCPPDDFTADGQLWGNPLYDWQYMKNTNYAWWVKRIEMALNIYDVIRIDHFRGFAGYFTIPYGHKTAKEGVWRKGPGFELFNEINTKLPNAKIIAENLGFLDDDVKQLLADCGYPGMHIVQFELGNMQDYCPLRDGFNTNNVIYTGTHDNQTIISWYYGLNNDSRLFVNKLCNISGEDNIHKKIIELSMASNPYLCIIPIQDYLGLTDEDGRMNTPSTMGINWRYRTLLKDFNRDLSNYIAKITISNKRYCIKE